MLRVHKLIEQITNGWLNIAYRIADDAEPRPNLRIPGFLEPLFLAHKFALRGGVISDDSLRQTGIDLWRAKVLKPPYPLTWIEVDTSRSVIGLLVSHDEEACVTTADLFSCWSGDWLDHGVQLLIQPDAEPMEAGNFFYMGQYYDLEQTKGYATDALIGLVSTCCALISKESKIDTIDAPTRLNQKRAKAGKPPLFEHKVLTVPGLVPVRSITGTHATPRLHWRRGHVRRLPSGILTAVSPCFVGLAERGIVSKDYVIALQESKKRGGDA